MRIAVIAHLKFPISQPFHGGLEMHTHQLVEQLNSRDHQVTLFALPDSDPEFNLWSPDLDAVTMQQGIDLFEEAPGFGPDFVNKFHAYLQIILEIQKGQFDVVHNNCLHFLPLSLAHTLPCPMVTTLHTPPFPSLQSGAMLARDYPGNKFVSVSNSLGTAWNSYIREFQTVYNGLEIEKWAYSVSPVPRTAVWIGRLCPEKGAEYAIRAARRAGYSLKLAGSIYDQQYFDQSIAPLLGDGIDYVGHLDHGQINELVGQASVGLFTSTWDEPFGLVLLEMLACGTPLVAFDSGAAKEIITPECGVVVPKYDEVALATAMPRAARIPRTNCRERAKYDFPLSRMVEGYERIYRQLIPTKVNTTLLRPAIVEVA